MQQFQFQDINVSVTPTHDARQWYMTVEQVAEAYEKLPNSIIQTLGRHQDEIRRGVEADVTICQVRSHDGVVQRREQVILYREGVIKLGFFVRGPRAAAFRQFATDLVVQHLQQTGQDTPYGYATFMERFDRLEQKLDDLSGIADTVFGDEKPEITNLVQEVARMYKVDGRTVWGWVQTECDVGSYKKQNMKVKNFLLNKLGRGIRLVKEEGV